MSSSPSPSSSPHESKQSPVYSYHRLPDSGQVIVQSDGRRMGGTFNCSTCGLALALTNELVSKAFSGRLGRAYLFNTAINVTLGPLESRALQTGKHQVQDCACRGCGEKVGWRYEGASEAAQRYKEGKFILEKERIIKERGWEFEVD